jgi:hypothetical protein
MLRTHAAIPCAALGLIAAAVLAAPPSATAGPGAPTCNGQDATIVGEPGAPEVDGTPGDDVIVATDTDLVDAGAGDDTICMTGEVAYDGGVIAGPGNDHVDATAVVSRRFLAQLDDGGDIFVGSPGADHVYGADSDQDSDTEPDYIYGRDGNDFVASGAWGQPNDDFIELGPGADKLSWAGTSGGNSYARGAQGTRDWLFIGGAPGASTFVVDVGARTATVDREVATEVKGFEWVSFFQRDGSVTFLGTDRKERVAARWVPLTARMGGGNDRMDGSKRPDALFGGPGKDRADGNLSIDRCVAEEEEQCER